jgi:3-oxoacyl-[acyl-carrier protein] reductase
MSSEEDSNDDLVGKRVLVTGASTGIGLAVAKAFVTQGADVAIHCNTNPDAAEVVATAIRANGRRAFIVQADLSKKGKAARVVN